MCQSSPARNVTAVSGPRDNVLPTISSVSPRTWMPALPLDPLELLLKTCRIGVCATAAELAANRIGKIFVLT